MSNAKTYETKKEGGRGDSIKALTELKSEATSLSLIIKKSLSQSLALSKQLKEKINTLKAKEAEKSIKKNPEIESVAPSTSEIIHQQSSSQENKAADEHKTVLKDKFNNSAQKNDKSPSRERQA